MNTNRHRWWRPLAILFAFALLATACGGSDDSADDSASDSSAQTDTADSSADTSDDEPAMAEEDDDTAMAEEEDSEPAPTPEPVEIDEATVISDECGVPDPADEVELDISIRLRPKSR